MPDNTKVNDKNPIKIPLELLNSQNREPKECRREESLISKNDRKFE